MEIQLSFVAGQVQIICNDQVSHKVNLETLLINDQSDDQFLLPFVDPVGYGQALFAALFPPDSLARQVYERNSDPILLVATQPEVQAIAWEYLYGPQGFVVCERPFMRGLPPDQRISPPSDIGALRVVVISSNPVIPGNHPLPVETEWEHLKKAVNTIDNAVSFVRARPATTVQLRKLVAGKQHQVIHFIGHGNHDESGNSYLCFENEDASLAKVSPLDLYHRIHGTTFLVTLNACVSATPGPSEFSNLALSLVKRGIPYVLGMQFEVPLDTAQTFSHSFYSDLARGSTVMEALFQARLSLANSSTPWAVGIPVLYTCLAELNSTFTQVSGQPSISELEKQPPLELLDLPKADKLFIGRVEEIARLGQYLTGPNRERIVTIHAGGGQGKTALAREVVERFAWAWPGGVFAFGLEKVPEYPLWLSRLAEFCQIQLEKPDPAKLERLILGRLKSAPTLLVLDNAETFVEDLKTE
jgi:hypothetical protein